MYMMSFLTITILTIFFFGCIGLLASKWVLMRGGYHAGAAIWTRSLPTLSAIGFTLVVLANLTRQHTSFLDFFSFGNFFSFPELLFLVLCGGFYMTRLGQLIAALCTSWILLRTYNQPVSVPESGLSLAVAFSVIVAVLGDFMPWFPKQTKTHHKSNIFRAVLLISIAVAAAGVTMFSLTKLRALCLWLPSVWHTPVTQVYASALLYTILVGWTMVALGSYRHLLLFLLSLPTLTLVAFATGWNGPILAASMTLLVSLAIASADRRFEQRVLGQDGKFTMVLFGNPM
jgi:hypothetical protein